MAAALVAEMDAVVTCAPLPLIVTELGIVQLGPVELDVESTHVRVTAPVSPPVGVTVIASEAVPPTGMVREPPEETENPLATT
jgi:hypothetical protein